MSNLGFNKTRLELQIRHYMQFVNRWFDYSRWSSSYLPSRCPVVKYLLDIRRT